MSFPYKVAVREERVGADAFRIESLENLDKTIDELFEVDPALLESACPYFGVVWPSARGLAEHLLTLSLPGTRMLEIGCGLALPSLVAARAGALVTASDSHPDISRFLERNLELNGLSGRVQYASFDWRADASEDHGRYELVVGSDILYEKEHPGPVARALARHVAPGGRLVLADPGRPYLQQFADEMRALGFTAQVLTRTVADLYGLGKKDVFLLEFRSNELR